MSLAEDRDGRLAYPIPELARKLGVNRKTIERRIADGTFSTISMLGRRLITADSVRAMFAETESPSPSPRPETAPTHP